MRYFKDYKSFINYFHDCFRWIPLKIVSPPQKTSPKQKSTKSIRNKLPDPLNLPPPVLHGATPDNNNQNPSFPLLAVPSPAGSETRTSIGRDSRFDSFPPLPPQHFICINPCTVSLPPITTQNPTTIFSTINNPPKNLILHCIPTQNWKLFQCSFICAIWQSMSICPCCPV